MMEKLLTTEDVCNALGVKPRTVARLVHDGKLACIQITARERRFLEEQVTAFIEARTTWTPKPVDGTADTRLTFHLKSAKSEGGEESTGSAKELREEIRKKWL